MTGFHYPSWPAELTARELWCIFDTRQLGVKNAPEFTGRQLGRWTQVVEATCPESLRENRTAASRTSDRLTTSQVLWPLHRLMSDDQISKLSN